MALKNLVETAFATIVAALDDLPAGTNVYTGEDNETQIRPCVVCHCLGGPEEPQGSGNRMMSVNIIMKSQADQEEESDPDTVTLHAALVLAIEQGLKVDDLADQLSATMDGFTAFDPVIDEGQSADPTGRAFTDTQQFRVYCCLADVT